MINGGIYTTIVYKKDMRSGITYAYDSKSHWDKEKQQSPLMDGIVRPKPNSPLNQTKTSHTSITVRLTCSPSWPWKQVWLRTYRLVSVTWRTWSFRSQSTWCWNLKARCIGSITGKNCMFIPQTSRFFHNRATTYWGRLLRAKSLTSFADKVKADPEEYYAYDST